MRAIIIILGVLLVTCLVSSTPIDHKRWPINRPMPIDMTAPGVKGGVHHTPGPAATRGAHQPLQHQVAKGEYVCGDKICKLTPGEIPKGCNGLCQYPI